MVSAEEGSFGSPESKGLGKTQVQDMHRDLWSSLGASLESWSVHRQPGVVQGTTDTGRPQKSSVNPEEPQAEDARTTNTRISVHQVLNPRAEGGTVPLGEEHFPPVALKQHGFVSWKHLKEIRHRNIGFNSIYVQR